MLRARRLRLACNEFSLPIAHVDERKPSVSQLIGSNSSAIHAGGSRERQAGGLYFLPHQSHTAIRAAADVDDKTKPRNKDMFSGELFTDAGGGWWWRDRSLPRPRVSPDRFAPLSRYRAQFIYMTLHFRQSCTLPGKLPVRDRKGRGMEIWDDGQFNLQAGEQVQMHDYQDPDISLYLYTDRRMYLNQSSAMLPSWHFGLQNRKT